MTTNNYVPHHHCGVVLQERKNDDKQHNCSSSLWCGFVGAKKQQ